MASSLEGCKDIVVWGAGGLGRNALTRWLPAARVSRVVDPAVAKQGTEFCGKIVQAPDTLQGAEPDCIVICSTAYREILEQIDVLGLSCPRFYVYELFLPEQGGMSEWAMLKLDLFATKNDPFPLLLMRKPQVMVNITFRLARQLAAKPLLWPLYAIVFFMHHLICWLT